MMEFVHAMPITKGMLVKFKSVQIIVPMIQIKALAIWNNTSASALTDTGVSRKLKILSLTMISLRFSGIIQVTYLRLSADTVLTLNN